MNVVQPEQAQVYYNAMESAVLEEVDKQFQHLSSKVASYLNKAEVMAYALNRLPALYATSEQGWKKQQTKLRQNLKSQITVAVRQAIVAVQQDPLRRSTPLKAAVGLEAQAALQDLKELLQQKEVSWRNLVDVVEFTLIKTAHGEISWRRRNPKTPPGYDSQGNR